ncbi:hypothetical protein WOLCODRAFT_157883 [Wolfiporia cocos MD-104 SS10]|uniref:Uncharacterized protein n=1 Tax=Wolfiporia cocos (strain MD-104) TaxID=742152 RepID=A0A2H3J5F0_WOLCO|nr:hypothetical protein WOLCODRAFT_157883 [Wolfiporia cocos MD-104 SS10]
MIIKLGYFLTCIYMFLIKNIQLGYSLVQLYLSSHKVLFQALGDVGCGLNKDGQGTMEDEIMISQGFCLHDLLPDPKKMPTAFPDKKITQSPPIPPPNNITIFSKSAPDKDTTLIEDASAGHQTFSKCKRNITDDRDSTHADTNEDQQQRRKSGRLEKSRSTWAPVLGGEEEQPPTARRDIWLYGEEAQAEGRAQEKQRMAANSCKASKTAAGTVAYNDGSAGLGIRDDGMKTGS